MEFRLETLSLTHSYGVEVFGESGILWDLQWGGLPCLYKEDFLG